ncbi:MAG: radical SAM family heme chaperone HemW [Bacteroidales bacterium]|nr:radical SAM family heme chaperone HemW [Bacteroidales bacterium]MCM1147818.1 radical SAM family heme chaperone HemW [Bacteroidales bacterium]MCM1206466.1 radical SAM family heme chaperone HemW [Bacillota bacterium]MCM1510351.1 radical SAM family heme chaperone HemW [Clostridium sp.]
MAGLYVHIPFCASRCIYCGFYSTTGLSLQKEYVHAVLRELDGRLAKNDRTFPCSVKWDGVGFSGKEKFTTVYFGGGTPSTLGTHLLDQLVRGIQERVDTSCVVEWTMECNPDDVTEELAAWIGRSPINRVSMGAQTFSDARLRRLCRRHSSSQVVEAVAGLRRNGIRNISIDLMFGFPSETLAGWDKDIDKTLALRPEHISAYSLMYEEGTPLYSMLEQGKVAEIDEELSWKMYDTLVTRLTDAGYVHYEISNFCQPSFRSRHNSSYWHQVPYLGLGASAHSYSGSRRWWNVCDVKEYIRLTRDGIPVEDGIGGGFEYIDDTTRYNDIITTSMRTKEGVPLRMLPSSYRNYLLEQSEKHRINGTLTMEGGTLRLTKSGIYVSDDIMSDLIFVAD